MAYAYGEPVTLTLTDSTGATANLANYADVVLTIVQPDGTNVTLKKSDATLTANPYVFQPTQSGRHVYYYVTTTPNGASSAQPFEVETAGVAPLVSLADAKAQLNITDASQDDELQGFIDAATAVVEGIVGPVVRRTYTEVHDGGGPFIVLNNPPIISVTSVTEMVGPTAYTLTDAEIDTVTGAYSYSIDSYERGVIARRWSGGIVGPFVGGVRNIQVVYVSGRTSVPAPVRMGALLLIEHMWEQTQRGNSTNQPVPGVDEADVPYGSSKETQAFGLLAPYRKAPALA